MPCLIYLVSKKCKEYIASNNDLNFINNYQSLITIEDVNDNVFTTFHSKLIDFHNSILALLQHPDGIYIKDICEDIENGLKLCVNLQQYLNNNFTDDILKSISIKDKDTITTFYESFIKTYKTFNQNILLRLWIKHGENIPFYNNIEKGPIEDNKIKNENVLNTINIIEEEITSLYCLSKI